MPKFWNTLAKVAEHLLAPDDNQQAQAQANTAPAAAPSFNGVNAMANATPPNPALRRLFSLNGPPSQMPTSTDVPPDGQYDVRDPAYQPDTPPSRFAQIAALTDLGTPTGSGREMPVDTPPIASTAPPRSQTETDVQALRDAQSTEGVDVAHTTERAKKRNMFSRFVRAAGDTLRNGGDWYSAAVEGVAEAASPAERAKRLQQQKMQRMFGRVAQDTQIDSIEQKNRQEAAKTIKETADARFAVMKPFIDKATEKGYLTDEELNHIKVNGVDMTNPNNPVFVETEVNGKHYIRRKNEPGYAPNATLPGDLTKTPVNTTITTGGKDVTLPLTPGQAASTLVGAADRAERAAQAVQKHNEDVADKEYKDKADFDKDHRKWEDDRTTAAAKKAKANKALPSLRESRAALAAQQFDTTQIDKSIADFEGDVAEADVLAGKREPKYVPRTKSTTSKGGKNNNVGTEDDYRRALKKLKP